MAKEAPILKAILDYLAMSKILHWRVPLSPVIRGGGKRRVIFSPNPMRGFPDIAGIVPGSLGQLFVIEVKTSKTDLEPAQEKWRDDLTLRGVVYLCARSVGDVTNIFENKIGK